MSLGHSHSESALKLLDVSADVASKDEAFIAAVTGNERLPGSEPYAHAYAGHQVRLPPFPRPSPRPSPRPRPAPPPSSRAPAFIGASAFALTRTPPCLRAPEPAPALHQFGSFAGQLGDGRAISLGEVVNGRGERWEVWFGNERTNVVMGRQSIRARQRMTQCPELGPPKNSCN